MTLRARYRALTPIGASPGVGRIFLVCRDCSRVVPRWRVIRKAGAPQEPACRCGCPYSTPRNISELRAAYWVLIRGLIWRKWIRRHEDWEPRMPWRHTPAKPS